MGVVVGEPVHLPGAEELGACLLDDRVAERKPRRRLLEHDLADVGGIDGHPAIAGQVDLGPAVLGLADVPALAEAAECRGVGAAHAVHVARR